MESGGLTSRRPYLIRAMREWMLDNSLTPHIVVDAHATGVSVPEGFARDGRIILNVSDSATDALHLGNDHIAFSARFGGTPRQVSVPVKAVLGIYARETEQGMVFGMEAEDAPDADSGGPEDEPPTGGGKARAERASHLKVVK
jgi:stringent starvation protein B